MPRGRSQVLHVDIEYVNAWNHANESPLRKRTMSTCAIFETH
jgi:hypothetical protein